MKDQNSTPEGEPVLFKARIFDVVERQQKGRDGRTLQYQTVRHPGAVGIVPILPDGRVLLISQFRITFDKAIYEIPAGVIEIGEAPAVTAKRELIEETGYSPEKLELLSTIYTSPGILQEELAIYLATDLKKGQSSPENGEKIVLQPKTWSEIDALIEARELKDAKSLAGLFLARRKLGIN
ncbi:MAG: NUDIX hydrolase [Thermoguttaceae bacterium]|jgi:ADP-ribose pyrophosphatase